MSKCRISAVITGALVATACAAPGAFGSNSGTVPGDFGVPASDGTVFRDGVMTLNGPAAGGPAQGEGWKLGGPGKSLGSGYTIKFYDRKSVDWLGRYVKASAAELRRVTGLPVSVDTRPVGWNYARPKGEIVIGVLKRPCLPPEDNGQTGWKVVRDGSGTPNLSCGFYSSSVPGTVTSGHAYIDSSFLTADGKPLPSWGETFTRNHISHELGHTMGLTHADRSAKRGDCAKGSDSGEKPVMCTDTSGYQDKRAGTYVQQFDLQGLRYLARGGGAALPPQGRVTGLGGKCLDAAGTKAVLDDCTGRPAQRWSVNAKRQIVHVASGKVLDVTDGRTANGTKVRLHTANTYKRQLWSVPK